MSTVTAGAGMRLTDKYRPHSFEAVRGQDHAVRVLSGYIKKGKVVRDLLLIGSVGSGKTSLARIYGRALNCDHPLPSGSPCERCPSCREVGFVGYAEHDVAGQGRELKDIENFAQERLASSVPIGKVRVLCFDEAHRLTKDAAESLLKRIEDRDSTVAFVFATTAPEQLPHALRSRLVTLQVRPLVTEEAIAWLKGVAEEEGVLIDDDALKLIVGLRKGYPRDLLNALEFVRSDRAGETITLGAVRELFDVEHIDILPRYFGALARRDIGEASRLFQDWAEPLADKVKWIQSFMVTLYFGEILRIRGTVDAAVEAIAIDERLVVLQVWCTRLGVSDSSELRAPWSAFMSLLSRLTPAASDAEILIHIATFQEALTADDVGGSNVRSSLDTQQVVPTPSVLFQPDRPAPLVAHPQLFDDGRFLEITDVRDVLDAASVLIQEEGRTFNLYAEVRFTPFQEDTEEQSVVRAERWMRRLMEWRGANDEEPASVWSITREGAVFILLIAAELPTLRSDKAARQQRRMELDAWISPVGSDESAAVEVKFDVSPGGTQLKRTRFHWKAAHAILRTVEPELLGFDDAAQRWLPLYELIGLKKSDMEPTGPVRGRPIRFGGRLSPENLERAARNGMGFISAFRDRRWDVLKEAGVAWEFLEHEERIELRRGDRFAAAGSRPVDPRDRPRSFLPWWRR